MGELYHGSNNKNLTVLEPHKSTHGTFVYATKYKELATVFARKCGDDLTFSLYRQSDKEPWQIVERFEGAFDIMFENEATIYTVDDKDFKDIHTGFAELVADTNVKIQKKEEISNVYEALQNFEKTGQVKLYTYPNRPKDIPLNDSDLILKTVSMAKRRKDPITKDTFARLLYIHPHLLDSANKVLAEETNNCEKITPIDLVSNFDYFIMEKMAFNEKEEYFSHTTKALVQKFPELTTTLHQRISMLSQSKTDKINFLLSGMKLSDPDLPLEFIEEKKKNYFNDPRDFKIIAQELFYENQKIRQMNRLVSSNRQNEIFNESVLLIGPIDKEIKEELETTLNLPFLSMEQEKKKQETKASHLSDLKEKDFYEESLVFQSIDSPSIINLENKSKLWEDKLMQFEMNKILKKFTTTLNTSQLKNQDLYEIAEQIKNKNHYSNTLKKGIAYAIPLILINIILGIIIALIIL